MSDRRPRAASDRARGGPELVRRNERSAWIVIPRASGQSSIRRCWSAWLKRPRLLDRPLSRTMTIHDECPASLEQLFLDLHPALDIGAHERGRQEGRLEA